METAEIKMIEWFDDHFYKISFDKESGKDSIYIPSVTTKLGIINKPFLARWRGDIGNREADLRVSEASERGIRIHNGWYVMTTAGVILYQPIGKENYSPEDVRSFTDTNGGNISIIRNQDEMFDLWKLQKWVGLVKPKFISSELPVYSLQNLDAGTLDNLVYLEAGEYAVNGSKPLKLPAGLYVIDLKSGKGVDDTAFMQTACYANCVKEMGLGECIGTLILHTQAQTRSAIEGLATLYRNKEQMDQDYQDYRLASALWERKNRDMKPRIFEFPTMLKIQPMEG